MLLLTSIGLRAPDDLAMVSHRAKQRTAQSHSYHAAAA
jgi:hypothetical protein